MSGTAPIDLRGRAAEIHRDAVVVDAVDVSIQSRARFERMRDAGLTVVGVTVAIYEGLPETMRNIARWEQLFEEHSDLIRPVRSVGDIEAAKREGRVGVIYGFQNTSPLEDDFGYIGLYNSLGVRVVQLAYMYQNLIGSGCLEPTDAGLTDYGRDVVRELQRQGIAIDLSHCGPKTSADVLEMSSRPVFFTHAASRVLHENARNRWDEELERLAATGGVIGVVAFPSFLKDEDPTIEDWFRHLEHIVSVVGSDHVGIGCDFIDGQPEGFADRAYYYRPHPPGLVPHGWPWPYPQGLASVDDYANITEGLVERGFDEEAIRKILGGNFVRALGDAWGESPADDG